MMKDKVTVPLLVRKKERGEKIVMVTCYDAPHARLLDDASVDVLLVGDSLGDNVLGYENTIPVTLEQMIHHTSAVCRGARRPLVIADMPFMSYQVNAEEALRSAGRLVKEAGAEAVKLEGGAPVAQTVRKIVDAGIPVMGHLGLTPQSVHRFGGYRVQGKAADAAERILCDAQALVEAGVFGIVLELVPAALAKRISEAIPVPTIGIGAGPHCDGQVLVLHDLIGMRPDGTFRHVRRYAEVGKVIQEAVAHYASDVRSGSFPTDENAY